jgi:hypothetical protein
MFLLEGIVQPEKLGEFYDVAEDGIRAGPDAMIEQTASKPDETNRTKATAAN